MDEALTKLFNCYFTIAIEVKQIKGDTKILLIDEPSHICSTSQKLMVAKLVIAIGVE